MNSLKLQYLNVILFDINPQCNFHIWPLFLKGIRNAFIYVMILLHEHFFCQGQFQSLSVRLWHKVLSKINCDFFANIEQKSYQGYKFKYKQSRKQKQSSNRSTASPKWVPLLLCGWLLYVFCLFSYLSSLLVSL